MQGDSFKALKILHTALLMGFGLMMVVMFVVTGKEAKINDDDKTLETALQAIAAVMSIGSLLLGFSIFKKRLVASRNINYPAEKRFEMYRAACIFWWALLEGPGLFATIAYYLTSNYVFIVLALFHLGMLAVFMPRKDNIVLLLNLTSEDVQRLEGTTQA